MKYSRHHQQIVFREDWRADKHNAGVGRPEYSLEPTGTYEPKTKKLIGSYDLFKSKIESSNRR